MIGFDRLAKRAPDNSEEREGFEVQADINKVQYKGEVLKEVGRLLKNSSLSCFGSNFGRLFSGSLRSFCFRIFQQNRLKERAWEVVSGKVGWRWNSVLPLEFWLGSEYGDFPEEGDSLVGRSIEESWDEESNSLVQQREEGGSESNNSPGCGRSNWRNVRASFQKMVRLGDRRKVRGERDERWRRETDGYVLG